MTSSWKLVPLLALAAASTNCNRRHEPTVSELVSASDPSFDELRRGERSFAMRCASCHAREWELAGPSVREIASIHGDAPDGIVRWARTPGRKRPNKQKMPSFDHLAEDDLGAIARYIVWAGRQDAGAR
jgi:mono/diheme cytochrome c family protein